MKNFKKVLVIFIIFSFQFSSFSSGVMAQTPTLDPSATVTPAPEEEETETTSKSDQLKQLQNKIKELEGKVKDLQSQKTSLSSQISLMDNQIELTEYRISSTEKQIKEIIQDIQSAEKRIKTLESSVDNMTRVFLNRVVTTYQVGGADPTVQSLFRSSDTNNFISRGNYLRFVREHDKQLMYETVQAKNDYTNQKGIFEGKKKKVELLQAKLKEYTDQLDKDKAEKERLLQITKNDESHYQSMLNQARAQINAFKSFATSKAGSGASILPPQSSADGWYYNQRDERWGNSAIGSSPEKIWEVGCLLTSMSMIMKKHGQDVTPAGIAANSSYFFSNTAYMLIPWGGGTFSSTWGYNQSFIDEKLVAGEPVIAGVKAGPYGMHFIVLKSVSGGSYVMHDPWNGADLNFTDYYTIGQIFQYGWIN